MNNDDLINLNKLENDVMSGLKDFQRDTVKRIMELYEQGQNRILVSDEVGLGKTLIAKGVIAKFIKLRKKENDDLVKVVYICSNAAIAQQNLDKLSIGGIVPEDSHTSRLSMQHLNIFKAEYNENKSDVGSAEEDGIVTKDYIQLIPLSPQTSFKVTNSQGLVEERALMYTILKHMVELKDLDEELSEFLSYGVKNNWEFLTKDCYDIEVNSCNRQSGGEYLNYMTMRLAESKINGRKLINKLPTYLKKGEIKKDKEARNLIIELRKIFTKISLDRLDPDLIIMDEFQRFKFLLDSDSDSDIAAITKKFFNPENSNDANDKIRILLLSATPYKMYSTLEEISDAQVDEHYKEFLDVINFLSPSEEEKSNFKIIWSNYSEKLKEISKDKDSFILVKNAAEDALYKNICRTERFAESHIGDIIDDNDRKNSLRVNKNDITSYKYFVELLKSFSIETANVPVDYIKSSPYLMSFMKDYKLKQLVQDHFNENPEELSKINKNIQNNLWIKKSDINNYREIKVGHARLNNLMDNVFKDHAECLLWVPPSKGYYPSEGVFKNTDNFSKTLIFSSWEMVPRMISTLVSYEVERRTIGEFSKVYFNKSYVYTDKRIKYPKEGDKPLRMTLLSLIYPSSYLSVVYNPIKYLNLEKSLGEIEDSLKRTIKSKLVSFKEEHNRYNNYRRRGSNLDHRWYYVAPLLLDCLYEKLESEDENPNLQWYDCTTYVENWFKEFKNALKKQNEGDKEEKEEKNNLVDYITSLEETFHALVYYAKNGYDDFAPHFHKGSNRPISPLGKKPYDLLDVLVDMSIASPAICSYRSYKRELSYYDGELNVNMEKYAPLCSELSINFLKLMNAQEAMAAIDRIYIKSKNPYWRKILTYSKEGNLQAVFDEYVHLLSNKSEKNNEKRILRIHKRFLDSINLNPASYDVYTFNHFKSTAKGKNPRAMNLRTHFAVSFTKGTGNKKDTDRKTSVRDAFNSPFRPFVLASTSIGQEGLDFHNYCRRIVHWNLPSNPIDLEQREGRINRFACLAIRQNIAKRYGDIEFKNNIWMEMFDKAVEKESPNGVSDLIPFWGLRDSKDLEGMEDKDMIKIERILPLYPFSIDEERYDRLINILSVYRLTLGQPRQEELADCLLEEGKLSKELFINLSPHFKKTA